MKKWDKIISEDVSPQAEQKLMAQAEMLLKAKRVGSDMASEANSNWLTPILRRRRAAWAFAGGMLTLFFVPYLWRLLVGLTQASWISANPNMAQNERADFLDPDFDPRAMANLELLRNLQSFEDFDVLEKWDARNV